MSEQARSAAGNGLSPETLTGDASHLFAAVRRTEPVSWAPLLDSWIVTGYDEAVAVMRDAERFTVDDPRFTSAAVLGRSMLSLDGPEHRAHRTPFLEPFGRGTVRGDYQGDLDVDARRLVAAMRVRGEAELRTELAGPLATNTITRVLGLGADPATVLEWYRHISDGVVQLADHGRVSDTSQAAASDLLSLLVEAMQTTTRVDEPSRLAAIAATSDLAPDALAPSAAIVLFGAIETSEAMTANLLWHLLTSNDALASISADRTLIARAIDESLRLEPAAALVERFATSDVAVPVAPTDGPPSSVPIRKGDPVIVSLNAANRDPRRFVDPDRFDIHRANAHRHLAFAQGPHACLGAHLARAETTAALTAVLDALPGISLDTSRSTPPDGRVFRKPPSVTATWPTS